MKNLTQSQRLFLVQSLKKHVKKLNTLNFEKDNSINPDEQELIQIEIVLESAFVGVIETILIENQI
jgi:hypothetical protein